MIRLKKIAGRLLYTLLVIFLLMNVIACFQAYKFTHFGDSDTEKTQKPLSTAGKIKAVFLGINIPRPENMRQPAGNFDEVVLKSNKKIACWHIHDGAIPKDSVKGTVIICHGYGGEKSRMLDKAEIFGSLKYNTFLLDFMGSGGSEGSTTTIGFKEAEQVKSAYDYLQSKGEKNIYLMGTSMGAVAIMKAIRDYGIKPRGIILECPFGSMYQTVCARFDNAGVPVFPMAGLLVFWGGMENGFWGFGHNPAEYAKSVTCPALLLYGEQDINVCRQEIDMIYKNLSGKKTLKTFEFAGHTNYLLKYKTNWTADVTGFLNGLEQDGRQVPAPVSHRINPFGTN